jgi:hypothetical protein
MNPTKNLIEANLYMNPTKNLIELKHYMNPTKNLIDPKLYIIPTKNLIRLGSIGLLMGFHVMFKIYQDFSGFFKSLGSIRFLVGFM